MSKAELSVLHDSASVVACPFSRWTRSFPVISFRRSLQGRHPGIAPGYSTQAAARRGQCEINRDRASGQVRSSQRLRFPEIEMSAVIAGQGSYGSAINPPTLSLGLSLTPPVFNRFEEEIAKAKADWVRKEKAEAQVLRDVQTAFIQFKSARSRVERAERELLDHTKRTHTISSSTPTQKGAARHCSSTWTHSRSSFPRNWITKATCRTTGLRWCR